MKLLFSSSNTAEVGLLRSRLETAGISCEVRNESSPLPFAPELWVLRDEDYGKASELLADWQRSVSSDESERI